MERSSESSISQQVSGWVRLGLGLRLPVREWFIGLYRALKIVNKGKVLKEGDDGEERLFNEVSILR